MKIPRIRMKVTTVLMKLPRVIIMSSGSFNIIFLIISFCKSRRCGDLQANGTHSKQSQTIKFNYIFRYDKLQRIEWFFIVRWSELEREGAQVDGAKLVKSPGFATRSSILPKLPGHLLLVI